jgi:hypothetical protein
MRRDGERGQEEADGGSMLSLPSPATSSHNKAAAALADATTAI